MAFHGLREFLHHLEADSSLHRVDETIDPELESASFSLYALLSQGPTLLSERPKNSTRPL